MNTGLSDGDSVKEEFFKKVLFYVPLQVYCKAYDIFQIDTEAGVHQEDDLSEKKGITAGKELGELM